MKLQKPKLNFTDEKNKNFTKRIVNTKGELNQLKGN